MESYRYFPKRRPFLVETNVITTGILFGFHPIYKGLFPYTTTFYYRIELLFPRSAWTDSSIYPPFEEQSDIMFLYHSVQYVQSGFNDMILCHPVLDGVFQGVRFSFKEEGCSANGIAYQVDPFKKWNSKAAHILFFKTRNKMSGPINRKEKIVSPMWHSVLCPCHFPCSKWLSPYFQNNT